MIGVERTLDLPVEADQLPQDGSVVLRAHHVPPLNHDVATVAQLGEFDAIIDVRSPSEFALDHVPGAINSPVLDDEERAHIGTLYVQVSSFSAKKAGAALVARNIARHIEQHFAEQPKSWRPLVYCWRGGQRSAAMTHVLRQIGWDARRLSGGYKAFRHTVRADLEVITGRFNYRVICGLTGSGKSALLGQLERQGAQVLDLEKLASHRGSLLGGLPDVPQPSQKMFESRLWQILGKMAVSEPVYIESESQRIGTLLLPEPLIAGMRRGHCIHLETPVEVRVQGLLRDYLHWTRSGILAATLDRLTVLHGRGTIEEWKACAAAGNWTTFVRRLLEEHYDPAYKKSIASHYPQLASAQRVNIKTGSEADFELAAQALLRPAMALRA
jgi:tRNA 2-selenouridine synthase